MTFNRTLKTIVLKESNLNSHIHDNEGKNTMKLHFIKSYM